MDKLNLNKDHKATMFSALGAFILSMLIGLISGNPAAVVFVRALISALLFSAVVFGGLYLLRRYIPELQTSSEEAVSAEDADAGSRIDYSVEGESVEGPPVPFEESEEFPAEEGAGPLAPVTAVDSSEFAAGDVDEAGALMAAGLEGASLNDLDEITLGMSEENGEVEDLPSLDKLYEEHEQESVPDIGTPEIGLKDKTKVGGDYIEVGNARIPFEPEVLAKAVKKVMKQDE